MSENAVGQHPANTGPDYWEWCLHMGAQMPDVAHAYRLFLLKRQAVIEAAAGATPAATST